MNRKCVACAIGERYRPGPWTRGIFTQARFEGKHKTTEGDVCPDCRDRCKPVEGGAPKPEPIKMSLYD